MIKHITWSIAIALAALGLLIPVYHLSKLGISTAHADTMIDAGGGSSGTAITITDHSPPVIITNGSGTTILPPPVTIVVPDTIDPGAESTGLLGFLLSGQFIPAIGATLILFVWALRAGLALKLKWFATKIGGLVLAFGTVFLLFIGVAMQAHVAITGALLGKALTAGLVAAGGWGHLKDLIGWFQTKKDPTTPPSIPGLPTPPAPPTTPSVPT